jgi:hypothetical protein
LEAAPSGWIAAATPAGQTNCVVEGTSWSDPKCQFTDNTHDYFATEYGIGTGYLNTWKIILNSRTKGKAATVARAFQGGGKTDWYLPSKAELDLMYAKRSIIGGFQKDYFSSIYWSSSEHDSFHVWTKLFSDAPEPRDLRDADEENSKPPPGASMKSNSGYVRPVRAF